MDFQTLTHNGNVITLVTDDPDWSKRPEIKAVIATDIEEGRTGRENRRARHSELRHEITLTYTLEPEAVLAWQDMLVRPSLLTGYIGIPLPFDRLLVGEWISVPCLYAANYYLCIPSVGAPSIRAAAALTPAWLQNLAALDPEATIAPLYVGRFKKRPVLKALTDMHAQASVTLLEESPWDYRLTPTVPASALGPDWPESIEANWRTAPEDSTQDILDFTSIGNTRLKAVDGQEGAVRRAQKFTATREGREGIITLLNFFLARQGRVESFTVPWLLRPSDNPTDTVPHVTRVRFASDTLSLSFHHDEAIDVQISLLQVDPAELNPDPGAGEQPAQPAEAYLYRFSITNPDGTTAAVWRYTDWEHDLVGQENALPVTYKGDASGLIEHDAVEQDSELGDNSTTITMSASVGSGENPLVPLAARAIDLPLHIDILSCDPAAPAAAALIYTGTVATVEADGRRLTAKTSVLGGLLEIKVPSLYYSPICNWRFCGPGCSKPIATYTTTLQLQTQAGSTVTATISKDAPSAAPALAEYFARGYLIVQGAPAQIRQITGSAARVGNAITLTLKTPLLGFAQGMIATIRPDCDGSVSICRTRYDNLINFGGHPRMGPQNLSLPSVTADGGSKGK